jgi:hypothetical protein
MGHTEQIKACVSLTTVCVSAYAFHQQSDRPAGKIWTTSLKALHPHTPADMTTPENDRGTDRFIRELYLLVWARRIRDWTPSWSIQVSLFPWELSSCVSDGRMACSRTEGWRVWHAYAPLKAALLQNFMEEQLCSIVSEAFRYKIIFTSRNEVF